MYTENKLTEYQLKLVVMIVKEGNLHMALLSRFEKGFIIDTANRYAQFYKNLRLSAAQLKKLDEIGEKLYISEYAQEGNKNRLQS